MHLRLDSIDKFGEERTLAYQWAEYLVDEFGLVESQRVLAMYEDFGWISEKVRSDLEKMVESSVLETSSNYERPNIDWPPLNSLKETEFESHAYSLAYIIKISDEGKDLEGSDYVV